MLSEAKRLRGICWEPFGTFLEPLQSSLRTSRRLSGASWRLVGSSWRILGVFWSSPWSSGGLRRTLLDYLGDWWTHLGAAWSVLGISWKGLRRLLGSFLMLLGGIVVLFLSFWSVFGAMC